MTPKEFKEAMEKISQLSQSGDIEDAHADADELMCRILRELGYSEGVGIFEDMSKWYA